MTLASNEHEDFTNASLKEAREGKGYSRDDLTVTCGLTVEEIADIENGTDLVPTSRDGRCSHSKNARNLDEVS